MFCVVAPVDHAYTNPVGAESVTVAPSHKLVVPLVVTTGLVGFVETRIEAGTDDVLSHIPFPTTTE